VIRLKTEFSTAKKQWVVPGARWWWTVYCGAGVSVGDLEGTSTPQ